MTFFHHKRSEKWVWIWVRVAPRAHPAWTMNIEPTFTRRANSQHLPCNCQTVLPPTTTTLMTVSSMTNAWNRWVRREDGGRQCRQFAFSIFLFHRCHWIGVGLSWTVFAPLVTHTDSCRCVDAFVSTWKRVAHMSTLIGQVLRYSCLPLVVRQQHPNSIDLNVDKHTIFPNDKNENANIIAAYSVLQRAVAHNHYFGSFFGFFVRAQHARQMML